MLPKNLHKTTSWLCNISISFNNITTMAEYRISGVWMDATTDEITHYAVHEVLSKTILRAEKKSKAEVIALLEIKDNSALTWIWDYNKATWAYGEAVEVAGGLLTRKYLRCNKNKETDNLAHLVNLTWINL
jgi:hypothetical protein